MISTSGQWLRNRVIDHGSNPLCFYSLGAHESNLPKKRHWFLSTTIPRVRVRLAREANRFSGIYATWGWFTYTYMLDNEELQTVCQECGRSFEHLGSHLFMAHKILSKDYKQKYGLPYQMPLISEKVKRKKQISFERTRDIALANLTTEYSFKKGHTCQRRISQHERKVIKVA